MAGAGTGATSTRGSRTRSDCCRWCARRSRKRSSPSRSSTRSPSARGPGRSRGFASAAAWCRGSRLGADLPVVPDPDPRGDRAGGAATARLEHRCRVSRCAHARGLLRPLCRRRGRVASVDGAGRDGTREFAPPDRARRSLRRRQRVRCVSFARRGARLLPSSMTEFDRPHSRLASSRLRVLPPATASPLHEALPFYVRHRVALTTAERDAGARL